MFSLENEEAKLVRKTLYVSDGTEYTVSPGGEHGFFRIGAKTGPVPQKLSGLYTSHALAEHDIKVYLASQARQLRLVDAPPEKDFIKTKTEVREEKKKEKEAQKYGSQSLINVT